MVHKRHNENGNKTIDSTACTKDRYGSIVIVELNLIQDDGTAQKTELFQMSSCPYL
jgi:hypothetical protein